MSQSFLGFFSFLLSLSWLLPNHNNPWTSFHSEAWLATVLFLFSLYLYARFRASISVNAAVFYFAALSVIPVVQFALGLVYSFGVAWVNFIYLFGLMWSVVLGMYWEKNGKGVAGSFLFLTFLVSSFVSVSLQLLQWGGYDGLGVWLLNSGGRYFANVGQPNLLGTLIVLALIGLKWFVEFNKISKMFAVFLGLFLLLGLSMTGSRTGLLNMVLVCSAFFLYDLKKGQGVKIGLFWGGLLIYFIVLFYFKPLDLFGGPPLDVRTVYDPIRLAVWSRILEVLLSIPFWGYGWGQAASFYLSLEGLPNQGGVLQHAHNLVFDMIVYNGLLLGMAIVLFPALWVFRNIRRMIGSYVFFPAVACGVVFVHSMLEYPLHYAYFLLPVGVLMGVVVQQVDDTRRFELPVSKISVVYLIFGLSSLFTFIDYLNVESEVNRISYPSGGGYDFEYKGGVVLTQWKDRLVFANKPVDYALDQDGYEAIRRVVISTPSPFLYLRLAMALALGGEGELSRKWLMIACNNSPVGFVDYLEAHWEELVKKDRRYGQVDWTGCN